MLGSKFGKIPLSFFEIFIDNLNPIFILLVIISTLSFTLAEANLENSSPTWIKKIISWYEENKISKTELINALEFLDADKIIDIKSEFFRKILEFEEKSLKYEILVTKGEKHLIPLDKIKSGGPPPDGIPSIDQPKFVPASTNDFLKDDSLVIGINLNGETKAYPLSILTWHEIVNDNFGETPVAVTYCPLCFTNQVFERKINGQEVEFGTSGKLYNSNLVMYDRLTNTYWSQALGLAIKGELTGHELKKIPFDVIRWIDWVKLYPDTLVLTTETGHQRPYSSDPYSDYFKDPRVLFSVDNEDNRIPKKEIILGVEFDGKYKAYQISKVESQKIINDNLGDKNFVIISTTPYMGRLFDRDIGGKTLEFEFTKGKITDIQTQSTWNIEGISTQGELQGSKLERLVYDPGFWFEWVAFHPETDVYD